MHVHIISVAFRLKQAFNTVEAPTCKILIALHFERMPQSILVRSPGGRSSGRSAGGVASNLDCSRGYEVSKCCTGEVQLECHGCLQFRGRPAYLKEIVEAVYARRGHQAITHGIRKLCEQLYSCRRSTYPCRAARPLDVVFAEGIHHEALSPKDIIVILKLRADPNTPAVAHKPLYYVVERGYIGLARLLIDSFANVNIASRTCGCGQSKVESPLYPALMRGSRAILDLLISHRADPNWSRDNYQLTGESDRAQSESASAACGIDCTRVSEIHECWTSQSRDSRCTPRSYLEQFSSMGKISEVELLLWMRADPNSGSANLKVLSQVCFMRPVNRLGIAQLLLEAKASDLERAGVLAGRAGDWDLVQLLLERSLDPNKKVLLKMDPCESCSCPFAPVSPNGDSVLLSAAAYGRVQLVQYLLGSGCLLDITISDCCGLSCIKTSCARAIKETLRWCRLCLGPASQKCARCKRAYYCCPAHQRDDWANHKRDCIEIDNDGLLSDDALLCQQVTYDALPYMSAHLGVLAACWKLDPGCGADGIFASIGRNVVKQINDIETLVKVAASEASLFKGRRLDDDEKESRKHRIEKNRRREILWWIAQYYFKNQRTFVEKSSLAEELAIAFGSAIAGKPDSLVVIANGIQRASGSSQLDRAWHGRQ